MEYFLQQLINGLTLGSIYGLIAIGYTMVYGIIGMINFAHGDIFMVGAFIALMVIVGIGLTGVGRHPRHPARSDPRHRHRHGVHRDVGLDRRARRLSAAARLVPAGAAHHGDRHVDRAAEFRADHAGRAREAAAADHLRRRAADRGLYRARHDRGADLLYADRHHRDDAALDDRLLAPHREDAARPLAARLRAGPEDGLACSASTSTAPSRSPSSWAPRSPPSPA